MNVDKDKYCSIVEFPFTRIQIILGLWCHGIIEKVFPTFDDVSNRIHQMKSAATKVEFVYMLFALHWAFSLAELQNQKVSIS